MDITNYQETTKNNSNRIKRGKVEGEILCFSL